MFSVTVSNGKVLASYPGSIIKAFYIESDVHGLTSSSSEERVSESDTFDVFMCFGKHR